MGCIALVHPAPKCLIKYSAAILEEKDSREACDQYLIYNLHKIKVINHYRKNVSRVIEVGTYLAGMAVIITAFGKDWYESNCPLCPYSGTPNSGC